jgi:phosphatidate cytidylyltransferase
MFTFPMAFVGEVHAARGVPPAAALDTTLMLVAIAKFSDVGGMVFGRLFGKRKLAPDLSPNKTLEGLIGGVILSIAAGAIIFAALRQHLVPGFTLAHIILLSALVSSMAVLGDLVESAIKRMAGVKDSGKIIPGIGGMFDLTDSLILALPIGIIYVKYAIV